MDLPISCPECDRDVKELSGSGKTRTARCPVGHRFEVEVDQNWRKAEQSLKKVEKSLDDINIDFRM